VAPVYPESMVVISITPRSRTSGYFQATKLALKAVPTPAKPSKRMRIMIMSTTLAMTRSRLMAKSGPRNTLPMSLADLIAIWRQRHADRVTLRRLDDHMLADIGLSRADVEVEIAKPFWRT